MTINVDETVEELIGNAATLALAEQDYERRNSKAIRAHNMDEAEKWFQCASEARSGAAKLQVEITNRMVAAGLARLTTAKVTARLEAFDDLTHGCVARLYMNGKRIA